MRIYSDGNGYRNPEKVNHKQQQEVREIIKNRVCVEFDDGPYAGLAHDSETVNCPKCGCNNSHLKHITFLADYEGRRESVKLRFEGECGHDWCLLFRQHKGTTYVGHPPATVAIVERI
jgi:hypothetical protein